MLIKYFWGLSPEHSVPVWRVLSMYVLQTPCFQSSTSLHDTFCWEPHCLAWGLLCPGPSCCSGSRVRIVGMEGKEM